MGPSVTYFCIHILCESLKINFGNHVNYVRLVCKHLCVYLQHVVEQRKNSY